MGVAGPAAVAMTAMKTMIDNVCPQIAAAPRDEHVSLAAIQNVLILENDHGYQAQRHY